MKIVSIGGGPAGLYVGILMKLADPRHEITVLERNRPDDTFGFGVVFSDATLSNLARADAVSHQAISSAFTHWDDIDTHVGGDVVRSTGHGFCGMERKRLLEILQQRAGELGVDLRFESEVTDIDRLRDADLVIGADGIASRVRDAYAAAFQPAIDVRPNRFVWLGTTFPFEAFTFYFQPGDHGLFRVHAYRYSDDRSTFIVECTGDTFARTGLAEDDEDGTIAYLERLFADKLAGHRLIKNRSIWRHFPTVRNARWHHHNVVLVGDAAHTAHFSIGSGTKLAMEDVIALRDAIVSAGDGDVEAALGRYEAMRRPEVESLQRAAQVSLEWFEGSERYLRLSPLQFTFSLLTRSLRVTHDGLRRRDPELVRRVDEAFAADAGAGAGAGTGDAPTVAPHRVAFELRGLRLRSRLVRVWDGGPVAADTGVCVIVMANGTTEAPDFDAPIAAVREAAARSMLRLRAGETREIADAAARALARGIDIIEVDVSLDAPVGRQLSRAASPGGSPPDVAALVSRVRARIGDAPLSVRISGTDWSGGWEGTDAVSLAQTLARAGADIVCVTAKPVLAGASPVLGRLYETPFADRVRNEAAVPTIAEGEVRSYDDVDSALAAGRADLFLLD